MITEIELRESQQRRCLVDGRPARIVDWWDASGYGHGHPVMIRVLEDEGLRRYDIENDTRIVLVPDAAFMQRPPLPAGSPAYGPPTLAKRKA